MKKIFTLIAVALCAMSVDAQGLYAVSEEESITAGDKITSVENVVMTYSDGGGTFIAGKKTSNWADADFTAYTNGSTNGKNTVDKDYAKVTDYTYMLPDNKDAEESQVFTQNEKGEDIIGIKSNGTVTVKTEAGGTYYVFAVGTKMGYFGFKFEAGGTDGIGNVSVD